MRVLFVEDDESTAEIVRAMLREEGHDCRLTASGKQAVQLGMSRDYDIVLLDIMLPDIDGIEVVRRLRQFGVDTPVLLQTGLVDRNNDLAGLGLGVANYLVKPFNKDELIERMAATVARTASPDGEHQGAAWEAAGDYQDARRTKTLKSGKILLGSPVECVLLDLSEGGAGLKIFDPELELPQTFTLEISTGAKRQCEIRWRSFDKIGVKFI
jgi:DNA-binding response OmpR family regulator